MTSKALILPFKSSISVFISSLRRFVCTSDDREHSGAEPVSDTPRRNRYRLPETIVDDAFAGIAFFAAFFGGMFVAWGLS